MLDVRGEDDIPAVLVTGEPELMDVVDDGGNRLESSAADLGILWCSTGTDYQGEEVVENEVEEQDELLGIGVGEVLHGFQQPIADNGIRGTLHHVVLPQELHNEGVFWVERGLHCQVDPEERAVTIKPFQRREITFRFHNTIVCRRGIP